MNLEKRGRPEGARQLDKIKWKGGKIKRNCLKCNRVFMAEGRFNRLCPQCNLLLSCHYSHLVGGEYTYPNTFYAVKIGSGLKRR